MEHRDAVGWDAVGQNEVVFLRLHGGTVMVQAARAVKYLCGQWEGVP